MLLSRVLFPSCTVFKPASFIEVAKLCFSSHIKFCEFDPIFTFLLKFCLHTLFILITKIIHISLSSVEFPSHFKHDYGNLIFFLANALNSYSPIYNISFASKVLEKVISNHFNIHLNCNHVSIVFSPVCLQIISFYINHPTKSS